jgi:outer membrane receptor protein involved in Fe transport
MDPAICGGLPVFNFPGGTLERIGRTTSQPQFQTPRSMNIRESFAWNQGAHALKFGAELLNVETGIRDVSSLLGQFNFTGRFTGVNGNWANSVAEMLLGFPSQYQQDSNTVFNIYQHMYFGFLQDDWKVSQKLTLNLGLRYEFATPPRERDFKWANFDSASGKFITATSGSLEQEALIKPDWNDVAPRFGFAYSATPKTVIRGAYGLFYNHANRSRGTIRVQSPIHHSGQLADCGRGRTPSDGRPLPPARRHTGWIRRYQPSQPGDCGA